MFWVPGESRQETQPCFLELALWVRTDGMGVQVNKPMWDTEMGKCKQRRDMG